MKKVRAWLYARVSTLQQVEGFGINRQVKSITDFLKYANTSELGYELDTENYTVLDDLGKSAYKGRNWDVAKSALGRFYLDVKEGRINEGVLICENIDRITRRDTYQQEELMYLFNHGIDVLEVETGMIYSSKKPESGVILSHSINRAHGESRRKSRMATRSWENKREIFKDKGGVLSKYFPRWLENVDNQYKVKEDLAESINYIFTEYENGAGVGPIYQRLNNEKRFDQGRTKNSGLLDYEAKPWTRVAVHKILRDRRVLGELVIGTTRAKVKDPENKRDENGNVLLVKGKTETILDAYPRIVSEELFERVQIILNSVDKPDRTTKNMKSLFKGMAKCRLCGGGMVAAKNGHDVLFLHCANRRMGSGCKAVSFQYNPFEYLLLKSAEKINWDEIYSGDKDVSRENAVSKDIAVLRTTLKEYNKSEAKARGTVRHLGIIQAIEGLEEQLEVLVKELDSLKSVGQKVELNIDVLKVCDQDNVSLRQDVNLKLRRVIDEILIQRAEQYICCELKYFAEKVSHFIIIEIKTQTVEWYFYDKNNNIHGKSASFTNPTENIVIPEAHHTEFEFRSSELYEENATTDSWESIIETMIKILSGG